MPSRSPMRYARWVRAWIAPARELGLAEALGLSTGLLDLAESASVPVFGAAVVRVEAPAIVLGALQRAGRVLSEGGLAGSVARRRTTGAAAQLDDGALLLALALPSVDAVFRDATPRTLVNRNVRLALRGFGAAGLRATYLGRDFVSCQRAPFALLGFDVTPHGALVLEILAARRGSLALPSEACTDLERATQRFGGKAPASLDALGVDADTRAFAERVLEAIVERSDLVPSTIDVEPLRPASWRVTDASSPMPSDARDPTVRPIPNGWLDVAQTPRGAWVGGDLLAPTFALGEEVSLYAHAFARGAVAANAEGAPDLPIDGALWSDVRAAL